MGTERKIVAYSGTHGTGKTTAMLDRVKKIRLLGDPEVKVGVIEEVVRRSPYPFNLCATEETQLWVFAKHISRELELCATCDVVVSDRACLDAVAYTAVFGFADLAESMFELSRRHMDRYDKIVFHTIANNNWLLDDGVRDTVDGRFRCAVEQALLHLYGRIGFERLEVV